MQKINNEATDMLFKAILSLKSIEECYDFFEDLCTINEILDMSQRMQTAVLLDKGESYNDIQKSVNISSATISRVNKCLNYGTGGYKAALESIKKENENG